MEDQDAGKQKPGQTEEQDTTVALRDHWLRRAAESTGRPPEAGSKLWPEHYYRARAAFCAMRADDIMQIMSDEARDLRNPESYARHTAAFAELNDRHLMRTMPDSFALATEADR